MTKSASSILVPSTFVIHLVYGAQFLNVTGNELLCAMVMISPCTKMQASL